MKTYSAFDIKERRWITKNVSCKEVADLLGVSTKTISNCANTISLVNKRYRIYNKQYNNPEKQWDEKQKRQWDKARKPFLNVDWVKEDKVRCLEEKGYKVIRLKS